jgi:hypothetical protein
MTYDGSYVNLYVNGKLDTTPISCTKTLIQTNGNLEIGRNGSEYFNGQIDDVRIYNYALTPEQIKQVYNGGAVSFQ